MKTVTHNIVHTLNVDQARAAVRKALSFAPAIVAFQEWNPANDAALLHFCSEDGTLPYTLCRAGAKGLPILLKSNYVKDIDTVHNLEMAPTFKGGRPTPSTNVLFTNKHGIWMSVLNTHPMAHEDRPLFREAHNVAISNITAWGKQTKREGFVPILLMDGNGTLDIPGLTVCWDGQNKLPTGPGGHTIDAVWTTKRSTAVDIFETDSDHNGVVATYDRF